MIMECSMGLIEVIDDRRFVNMSKDVVGIPQRRHHDLLLCTDSPCYDMDGTIMEINEGKTERMDRIAGLFDRDRIDTSGGQSGQSRAPQIPTIIATRVFIE
jgi:hypothetical protein